MLARLVGRVIGCTLVTAGLCGIVATGALAEGRPARIAVVESQDAAPYRAILKGYKRELKNRKVPARFVVFSLDEEGNLPMSLLGGTKSDPDLILALGPVASAAATSQIHDIPIIAALVRRASEVDESHNATGVLFDYPVESQLRWMQELLPEHRSVGVLFDPEENEKRIDSASDVAQELGMNLLPHEVHRPTDLPDALRDLSKNADLLWGIADQTVYNRKTAKQFIVFSFSNQIPLSGVSTSWVKAGALFGLERDYEDIGAQCGDLSVSVLRGKSVDRLGFSAPRRLLYSVNLKTARHMGIHIKDDVVQNAAYAFE